MSIRKKKNSSESSFEIQINHYILLCSVDKHIPKQEHKVVIIIVQQ